ncbi:Uncharacterised protein [Tsukamurella paurometabola]|uniref:Uncharacterized protein n=1 Tax=Tsukamurella paurometabola TaxID=2061 RepID=A0A3P8K7Z8_TSUPA|nr:Uncharacterised protein [Tsukamurella paurometabola]
MATTQLLARVRPEHLDTCRRSVHELAPRGYVTGHLMALRAFYVTAAARHSAVIEWVD